MLNQLEEKIGLPKVIRVDNGPEFISKEFTAWCERKAIEIRYIQPGKPTQNGFIERFNRTFREDVLDAYWFEDLEQLGIIAEKWRYDYNFYHPHKALEYKAPCQYASRYSKDLDPWKEVKMRILLNSYLSEKGEDYIFREVYNCIITPEVPTT